MKIPNKICSHCKEEKSFDEFHKNKFEKDGLRCNCKLCVSDWGKKYYTKNRVRILKAQSKYCTENKKKISERRKKYHTENREKFLWQIRKYYAKNHQKKLQLDAKRRKQKPERQSILYYFGTTKNVNTEQLKFIAVNRLFKLVNKNIISLEEGSELYNLLNKDLDIITKKIFSIKIREVIRC